MFKTQLCEALRFEDVLQECGEGVGLHQPFLIACLEFLWLNLLALEELVLAELSQGLRLCGGWKSSLGVPHLLLDGRQVGWFIYLFILVRKDGVLGSELDS